MVVGGFVKERWDTVMLAFFAGQYEWLIILVIALLLFGRRLPEVMRSMGKGIQEFKKGLRDVESDIDSAGEEAPKLNEGQQLPDTSESGSENQS